MSLRHPKHPNLVAGAGAGLVVLVPSLFLIHEAHEGPSHAEQVLQCAPNLGGTAVNAPDSGVQTLTDCEPFLKDYDVILTASTKGDGALLSYELPSQEQFLGDQTTKALAKDKHEKREDGGDYALAFAGALVVSGVVMGSLGRSGHKKNKSASDRRVTSA